MENEIGRIIDAVPGLIWSALPDGQIDFLNRPLCKYTGLRLDDALGSGLQAAIHPEDLSKFLERWRSILISGEPGEMETRLRRFDGEYRWFLISWNPMRNQAEHIVKWFGINTDIDDRRRAEEALRRRELSFRLIVDSIPAPVAVTTPTGEVEALNQPTLDYFGKTFEELKSWKSSDVVHPDDLQRTIAAQMEAHQNGRAYNVESRHRRADGIYRWFNVLGLPLRDGEGNILRWFHLQIDIDDRKRAEEALHARERELSQIINTIPALAWSARPDGAADFFNQHYLDFVGLSAEQVRDWGWTTAVHPADLDVLAASWQRIMASEKPGEAEGRLRRHDGEYRWFLMRANPLRDESGKITKWYGQNTDITELKVALERLQANQDLLDLAQKSAGATAFDWYTQQEINYWSPEQEGLFGLAPGTFDGKYQTFKKMLYAPDWPVVLEAIQHAHETGKVMAEYRVVWPDGSHHWLSTNGRMFFDIEGKPVRMVGFTSDVTPRKLAEAQLAGEKRLLEMVASGSALTDVLTALCKFVEDTSDDCYCGVYLIDWSGPKFRIGAVPSLPATFNDPVEGLTVSREVGPCGHAVFLKKQVIATDLETDPLWQESTIRPLALAHGIRSHWSTPICARDGGVLGTFAIFRRETASPTQVQQDLIVQVTHIASIAIERALSEAALKRSEAFLAQGQHLSSTGTYSWRLDTDEIMLSEELRRMYELDQNAAPTMERLLGLIHPEDIPMLAKKQEQIRADHAPYEHELRLRMPDGRVKYLRTFGQVIRHQDGRLESLGATQDVTQRRLAEEALDKVRSELARVTRAMSLGALTASIAHEVNQPLSGIITNASTCLRMLDADPANVDGARETARRTIRDGHRASDVITRLRALFSRKEATIEEVDLSDATREVIELTRDELQRNRVTVRTELADDLPSVMGDRVQLQQVIVNLVRNASDAMSTVDDHPRQLTIITDRDEDDRVRLSVQDVGTGFESESMNRLFEAFYTTKSDGMGIGLSVSRSIIENHQGRLWVTANEGPGATFSFLIPCAAQNAESADRNKSSVKNQKSATRHA